MPNDRVELPPIESWFSPEVLEPLVGTRQFARGMRQEAVTEGELEFPSLKSCYQSALVLGEVQRRRLPCYAGVDLSSPTRPGNAIVTVALTPVGIRIPVDVRYGSWKSPETAAQMSAVDQAHVVETFTVENNAYQQSMIDWPQADKTRFPWWTKVESHTTGKNKADPQYGVGGMEVEFKNKAWAIPSGEWEGHASTCACAWCEWKRQMEMYPRGAQTDFVMATWFAFTAVTRHGRRRRDVSRQLFGINNR